METKYIIGLVVLGAAGIGLYAYLNSPRATAPGSMDPNARDAAGAAVNPVGSPNASTAANDAAVIIGALAEFGQRGVDAALRIRNATQQSTTTNGPAATGGTGNAIGVYRAGDTGDRKDF